MNDVISLFLVTFCLAFVQRNKFNVNLKNFADVLLMMCSSMLGSCVSDSFATDCCQWSSIILWNLWILHSKVYACLVLNVCTYLGTVMNHKPCKIGDIFWRQSNVARPLPMAVIMCCMFLLVSQLFEAIICTTSGLQLIF